MIPSRWSWRGLGDYRRLSVDSDSVVGRGRSQNSRSLNEKNRSSNWTSTSLLLLPISNVDSLLLSSIKALVPRRSNTYSLSIRTTKNQKTIKSTNKRTPSPLHPPRSSAPPNVVILIPRRSNDTSPSSLPHISNNKNHESHFEVKLSLRRFDNQPRSERN